MKSILKDVVNEIVIEKSRFITYLFYIENQDEAKERIEKIKKVHVDATHVVYGFITERDERSNDNGEPKGTAGIPTIEVLRKEGLTNIIAITVRYFGGIKLGAGGLVRAYTKGVSEALKLEEFSYKRTISNIKLIVTYKDSSYLDKNLSLVSKIEKEYGTMVTYNIEILNDNLDKFKELFINFKDSYSFALVSEESKFI